MLDFDIHLCIYKYTCRRACMCVRTYVYVSSWVCVSARACMCVFENKVVCNKISVYIYVGKPLFFERRYKRLFFLPFDTCTHDNTHMRRRTQETLFYIERIKGTLWENGETDKYKTALVKQKFYESTKICRQINRLRQNMFSLYELRSFKKFHNN